VVSEEQERVVIRDNRKIDPVTGEVRNSTTAAGGAQPEQASEQLPTAETAEVPMVEAALLDERTRDLQRVQAEYANYRKRAERERLAAGEVAIGRALTELLPILDDLDRAKAHGDLTGGLKAIADKLEAVTSKLGLQAFGEVGDPFDPAIHEAVMHEESDSVTEPTCTTVMRPGFKHHDRLLRPAMVGVTDPVVWTQSPAAPAENAAAEADAQEDVSPASDGESTTSQQ
jgi:molecular chaperone GrpE